MHARFRFMVSSAAALVMALTASTSSVLAAATAPPGSVATTKTSVTAPKDLAFWRWADWSQKPAKILSFAPFKDAKLAGSIAVADLGTDGVDEIVVGTGFGVPSAVRILRGDGSEILQFAPFEETMQQGVNVAVGDLDGDGRAEIVVAAGPGADARIKVFDASGHDKLFSVIIPFEPDFRGGASIAVADLDGDGKQDIIAAAGPTGGPHVKAWRHDGLLLADFFAFDNTYTSGLNLAAGDLDGDGKAEIVTAVQRNALAYVRVWSDAGMGVPAKSGEFLAIPGGFKGGLNLAVSDLNGDGANEIVAAPNGGGGPHVHAFGRIATATGLGYEYRLLGHFFAYDASYMGGVLLASGTFSAGASPSLVTVPAERLTDGRPDLAQYINVDLSEQRLRAFEYGKLVKTFLVATGGPGYDTPKGEFSILEKPLMVNYKWSYGPNHPENYDLGWVKWNLRFYPHIYIHNAPWRKVFGVRGSHGCVNVSAANAEWIYNWTTVGTPISIQQ